MSRCTNGPDFQSAPADNAELFRKYYQYVIALVRRAGFEESRVEDVASEILFKFIQRGFLEKFDAKKVFIYDGKERPARFKSFLTKFVLSYLRGHWDKQQRERIREPLLCDMPVGTSKQFFGGTSVTPWVELNGPVSPGPEEIYAQWHDVRETVSYLRAYLSQIPARHKWDTCDLPALFDRVLEQIDRDGQWNAQELREHFAISTTAIHSWLWRLRTHVAEALGRRPPAKRPRVLKNRIST